MNAEQLRKNVGQLVRLRPHPVLVELSLPGVAVPTNVRVIPRRQVLQTDYKWRLEDVSDKGVTLHCLYTGHKITLGADNVREYRTPDFLLLKCQLALDGSMVHIEPK